MESESHRLVHSLTAHLALYHSHLYDPSPNDTPRDSILRWFSSLSPAHRQAALTVSDFSFIEILLQMKSRLRKQQGHSHFLLLPDILSSSHPSLPSLSFRPTRGLLSRSAASNLSAKLLSNSLLLFSSTSSGSAIVDALTVSELLVTDVDRFVSVMDGLSGRRFLCEEVEIAGLIAQWAELPWLKDMGYYSLESFVANRLEVVLRLAWISSQGAKKPKEKRLKDKAAEVTGKAANAFWRMKGFLGWWVGLDIVTRKGIISSFFGKTAKALVLLITRFLQHEHHCGHSMKQNLGSLLMDFLYFFGNVFDPRHMRISIQGSGFYMKRERGHSIDPIHIDDPLFPANNVGRNCFRIHQCIKAFADAYTTLENELSLISEEPFPTPTQSFKLLRKIVPSIDCME